MKQKKKRIGIKLSRSVHISPGVQFLLSFSLTRSVLFLLVAAVCLPLCDTQVSSIL